MDEQIEQQRQARIESAYWRLRYQMCDQVPNGDRLWIIAHVGYELSEQDRKNGRYEKSATYSAMAKLADFEFSAAYRAAVQL